MSHCCHCHHNPNEISQESARTMRWALIFAIGLNIAFIGAEVFYALQTHSLALMADAGHNLGDMLALVLAAIAVWVSFLKPGRVFTYGLHSATILATLANTIILLLTSFEIFHAALGRLIGMHGEHGHHHELSDPTLVMIVAGVAVLVKGITAAALHRGRKENLGLQAMYLHLLSDSAKSGGVILGALAIKLTGQQWIDPVIAIVIALMILFNAWRLMRSTFRLALQGVPNHIKVADVEKVLAQQEGVSEVHDLHIWALGTQRTAMSVHLVMPGGHPGDDFINRLGHKLEHMGINHSTFQIELGGCKEGGCECGG